jgi:mono/diheme cytochrome c family protein
MPSDSFSIMTDEDLSDILSFIKSYPTHQNDAGNSSYGPLARLGLVMGEYWVAAEKTQAEPWQEGFRSDPLKLGEYLAITACTECHGLELQGMEGFTPPLTIAKAYSLEDFRKLTSTGVGLGGRDLGLMSQMAEFRLKHLKDDEVVALHTYLQSR